MKKKRNPLLILLLVLAVLLVVYAGVVVIGKNQEKSKQKEEEAKKIYVTDLGKLSEIQFDVGNGEIQLVKEDGTWYDKNDKDFPLAQSYPKKMEKTFRKLEADRKLEDGDSLEAVSYTHLPPDPHSAHHRRLRSGERRSSDAALRGPVLHRSGRQ